MLRWVKSAASKSKLYQLIFERKLKIAESLWFTKFVILKRIVTYAKYGNRNSNTWCIEALEIVLSLLFQFLENHCVNHKIFNFSYYFVVEQLVFANFKPSIYATQIYAACRIKLLRFHKVNTEYSWFEQTSALDLYLNLKFLNLVDILWSDQI